MDIKHQFEVIEDENENPEVNGLDNSCTYVLHRTFVDTDADGNVTFTHRVELLGTND